MANVLYDFGSHRVINTGRSPMEVANNIIVQELTADGWRDVRGFNSLSDDYAYTNAREAAERRAVSMVEHVMFGSAR